LRGYDVWPQHAKRIGGISGRCRHNLRSRTRRHFSLYRPIRRGAQGGGRLRPAGSGTRRWRSTLPLPAPMGSRRISSSSPRVAERQGARRPGATARHIGRAPSATQSRCESNRPLKLG
jgi:hypothetical protein